MDYKKINEKLGNLGKLRHSSKPVHRKVVNEINDDDYGSQKDSNEIYEVYDIGLEGGIFIELQIGSDSYGYNEFATGVRFVKAQEKKITVYEYKG